MATSIAAIEQDVLARHGIASGTGDGLAALEATIAARGWNHRTEERAAGSTRRSRYQALVFVRGEGCADPRFPSMLAARGRGATEEAALAQAVARMLVREE